MDTLLRTTNKPRVRKCTTPHVRNPFYTQNQFHAHGWCHAHVEDQCHACGTLVSRSRNTSCARAEQVVCTHGTSQPALHMCGTSCACRTTNAHMLDTPLWMNSCSFTGRLHASAHLFMHVRRVHDSKILFRWWTHPTCALALFLYRPWRVKFP